MTEEYHHAALLFWLPNGSTPNGAVFKRILDDNASFEDIAIPYLELGDAIDQGAELTAPEGKSPWIKCGGRILGLTEIRQEYDRRWPLKGGKA